MSAATPSPGTARRPLRVVLGPLLVGLSSPVRRRALLGEGVVVVLLCRDVLVDCSTPRKRRWR
eukprot:13686889-Alexandrium_andersonii.AAC.1